MLDEDLTEQHMSPEQEPNVQGEEITEKKPARMPGRLVDENGVVLSSDESDRIMDDRLNGNDWRDGLK